MCVFCVYCCVSVCVCVLDIEYLSSSKQIYKNDKAENDVWGHGATDQKYTRLGIWYLTSPNTDTSGMASERVLMWTNWAIMQIMNRL